MQNDSMDRFDELFEDLAGQAEAERQREREGEFSDLVAESYYESTFTQRLGGSVGARIDLHTAAGRIAGQLTSVGDGCCLIDDTVLVMLASVEKVRLAGGAHSAEVRGRSARSILGQWCAERKRVRIDTADTAAEGTLHAAARDYVQLRERGMFELVPLRKIAAVRLLD